ncbi:MAG: imidazole glycerol phosphate synthase subunit HisH [Coriobacteriia bacterium]
MPERGAKVAIVDYGMGNLFSVKHACSHVGLDAEITADRDAVLAADAVILPGVGAFGDAMVTLRDLGMDTALREVAQRGTPLFGICLGLQLLMEVSHEFGEHEGLGLVPGEVVHLGAPRDGDRVLKVPQVGWNALMREPRADGSDAWAGTWFEGLADGTAMYFVHSFVVSPAGAADVLARTRYGDVTFCSALRYRNVFACQCHPERSGPDGLRVYSDFAAALAPRESL